MAVTTSGEVGPESMEAWSGAALSLLENAKALASEWHETSKDSDLLRVSKDGPIRIPPRVDPGPKAQMIIDAKLAKTKKGLQLAEGALQRCSSILLMLQHERQSKWAAFKVCEWRLALRARRPLEELFRDHLQEALEHEMEVLSGSRQTLAYRVAEAKVAVEDCDANRIRLLRNVRLMVCVGEPNPPPFQEAEVTSDEVQPETASNRASLQDSGMSTEALAELEQADTPLPPRPPVPCDAEALLRRAPELTDISLQLYRKGELLIEKEKHICDKASLRTASAFQKRNFENNALKKDLENQISEMNEAIATAELSISRMKKRIQHFGQTGLQPKVDEVSALVEKLRSTKEHLEADLVRKIVSMRIDDSCRKITPERSMQDPMTMPVVKMTEVLAAKPKSSPKGRRRDKMMKRQNSSPAIISSEIDTALSTATTLPPLSPAGSSSILKVAGDSSCRDS